MAYLTILTVPGMLNFYSDLLFWVNPALQDRVLARPVVLEASMAVEVSENEIKSSRTLRCLQMRDEKVTTFECGNNLLICKLALMNVAPPSLNYALNCRRVIFAYVSEILT